MMKGGPFKLPSKEEDEAEKRKRVRVFSLKTTHTTGTTIWRAFLQLCFLWRLGANDRRRGSRYRIARGVWQRPGARGFQAPPPLAPLRSPLGGFVRAPFAGEARAHYHNSVRVFLQQPQPSLSTFSLIASLLSLHTFARTGCAEAGEAVGGAGHPAGVPRRPQLRRGRLRGATQLHALLKDPTFCFTSWIYVVALLWFGFLVFSSLQERERGGGLSLLSVRAWNKKYYPPGSWQLPSSTLFVLNARLSYFSFLPNRCNAATPTARPSTRW
jgi:hypothetical protein